MIEETRYKETPTGVERSRMTTPAQTYVSETTDYRASAPRIIAWGPIWAGVVVAVATQVILSVLGMAIGLSIIRATDGDAAGATGFNVAAGIWWVITALASLFLGGWITGWLAAPRKPSHGAVNGLVLWCVITALSAALVTTTGGMLLGGGLGVMGGSMATNNQTQPASLDSNRTVQGDRFDTRADQGDNAFDTVTNRMQGPQAEQMAEAGAGVAWWTFVVLVMSAGAAMLGGAVGHRSIEYRRYA